MTQDIQELIISNKKTKKEINKIGESSKGQKKCMKLKINIFFLILE
jgi:hypothetical protein